MVTIFFKREGYNPLIDYIKEIRILWVVLTHAISTKMHDYTLFCLWGDMAVPLFLLIQCIHVYKKEEKPNAINWRKIWQRIIKPYLLVQFVILVIGVFFYYLIKESPSAFIHDYILLGGQGRGSFYPKMYLEFAILIPLFYPVFRLNSRLGGVFY